uniref:Uncharacterized protein n=1 Tax=Anopheles darlingi TaxID=43151 RepID=A0A2M4DCX3_ANODA
MFIIFLLLFFVFLPSILLMFGQVSSRYCLLLLAVLTTRAPIIDVLSLVNFSNLLKLLLVPICFACPRNVCCLLASPLNVHYHE